MNHRGGLVATGQIQCSMILGSGEPKTLTVLRHDFDAKDLSIRGMKNENPTQPPVTRLSYLGGGRFRRAKGLSTAYHTLEFKSRGLR